MPASSLFQARAFSDVATSTLGASGVESGTRQQGFPSRTGPSTVQGGNFTATATVLDRSAATLYQGQTLQLTAHATTADGTMTEDAIDSWASSDATVATVSATGLVTVVKAGTTDITATSGGNQSSACAITIVAVVTALILTPNTRSFAHTTTSTTTVTATDQFTNAVAVPASTTCASSDETKATVAIVTGTITITGVAAGTASVTASYGSVTSNACVCTLS